MIDFRQWLAGVPAVLEERRRGDGFARFGDGGVPDVYGTADAIGIQVSLGLAPTDAVATLRGFTAADGSVTDPSHGVIHSTATTIGARALLGDRADWPTFLDPAPEQVVPFLEGLDWSHPWLASHGAAGLLAIGTMTRDPADPWFDVYFEWLDRELDPATGLWPTRNIRAIDDDPGLFGNLGCSFHFHFLYGYHGRPIPAPETLVDTCLALLEGTDWIVGRGSVGYPQLDWAYSAARASRQAGYRVDGVEAALTRVATGIAGQLDAPTDALATELADLHTLAAAVALVAELERALPHLVQTGASLVAVTDVRPFI